jgi:aspartyl-tRNA synthetase
VFDLLGIDAEAAAAKFGFLLDAFRYGVPPMRRFCVASTASSPCWWARRTSARSSPSRSPVGGDPLTLAPSELDAAALDELGW